MQEGSNQEMYNTGEAADQVVKLALDGVEVALRLSGAAAKNIAAALYAVLKDENESKGRTRLTTLLKSGKELKVFTISEKHLKEFTKAAKRYGIVYSAIRDKTARDGQVDLLVRTEDAARINRIIERHGMNTVPFPESSLGIEGSTPEVGTPCTPTDIDKLLNEILTPDAQEVIPEAAPAEASPTPEAPEATSVDPITADPGKSDAPEAAPAEDFLMRDMGGTLPPESAGQTPENAAISDSPDELDIRFAFRLPPDPETITAQAPAAPEAIAPLSPTDRKADTGMLQHPWQGATKEGQSKDNTFWELFTPPVWPDPAAASTQPAEPEEVGANPTAAQPGKSPPSAPISGKREKPEKKASKTSKKRSVRKELQEIRVEQQKREAQLLSALGNEQRSAPVQGAGGR